MRCGNCGAEIDNGMTSCPYCGATVRYMGQSNNSWQQGGWSGQNTDFNRAPFELVLQLSCYDTSYSSVAELPEMTVSVG